MSRHADRTKETTTTTGTGNLTLDGAVAQFKAFSATFATTGQDLFFYAIVGQSGTEWEVGEGYLTAATTLVRKQVFESSNANALVSFSAGTKDVFVTIPAYRVNRATTRGEALAVTWGADMP